MKIKKYKITYRETKKKEVWDRGNTILVVGGIVMLILVLIFMVCGVFTNLNPTLPIGLILICVVLICIGGFSVKKEFIPITKTKTISVVDIKGIKLPPNTIKVEEIE